MSQPQRATADHFLTVNRRLFGASGGEEAVSVSELFARAPPLEVDGCCGSSSSSAFISEASFLLAEFLLERSARERGYDENNVSQNDQNKDELRLGMVKM